MARRPRERSAEPPARHSPDVQGDAAKSLTSAEIRSEMAVGFREQLARYPDHLVETVGFDRASEYGRRAARAALAPAVWAVAAEDRMETSDVVTTLGVTRQALSKRVAAGTIVGLAGRGTTFFPLWQFDLAADPPRVRPAVAAALAAWVEEAGSLDPFAVTGWARTQQDELGGDSPIDLIKKEGSGESGELAGRLVFSARVAASRLAQ